MSTARRRRARRGGERGLTLIELLVTLAIMAVGFLSLLSAFAVIERQVGSTSDAAQITTDARQVADLVESTSIAYVQCTGPGGQAPTGFTSYQNAIRAAVTTTNTISVTAVGQAQASQSSHTVGGSTVPLTALSTCSSAGTGSGADYGVQRISFKVVSPGGHTVARIVYKRWN